jgi:hypothetical protein
LLKNHLKSFDFFDERATIVASLGFPTDPSTTFLSTWLALKKVVLGEYL